MYKVAIFELDGTLLFGETQAMMGIIHDVISVQDMISWWALWQDW